MSILFVAITFQDPEFSLSASFVSEYLCRFHLGRVFCCFFVCFPYIYIYIYAHIFLIFELKTKLVQDVIVTNDPRNSGFHSFRIEKEDEEEGRSDGTLKRDV